MSKTVLASTYHHAARWSRAGGSTSGRPLPFRDIPNLARGRRNHVKCQAVHVGWPPYGQIDGAGYGSAQEILPRCRSLADPPDNDSPEPAIGHGLSPLRK